MTQEDLAKKVRFAMNLKNVTIKAAAEGAGFTPRMLQKFLSCKADLTVTKFFALCDSIGMPVEAILHLEVK